MRSKIPTLLGTTVGRTGLGLMGFTWRSQQTPDEQAFATMRKALELGANLWNSGEFYGSPEPTLNLQLLRRYFTKYPSDASKVVLSVKGGVDVASLTPRGSPDDVRRSVDNVLRILAGTKTPDIFECARVDRNVPIEETVRTLAEYVQDGKIGGIGLCEAGAATIRRAHAVHPIVAVEVEYSLWSTEIRTNEVADVCGKLGIPIVAYSPLGKGFLTGHLKSPEDIPEFDIRRHMDRFQPGNFEQNLVLVDKVRIIAERNGCTLAQLALHWVRAQSGKGGMPVLLPIPGSTAPERVEENCEEVGISEEDMREVEEILRDSKVVGGRYFKEVESLLFV